MSGLNNNRLIQDLDGGVDITSVSTVPAAQRSTVTFGARADGSVPEGADAQATQVWDNLLGILHAAGMEARDIVKLTAYVVGAENYPAYASARSRVLGGHRPASTAVCVASLLRPEWLIEVEMIAARAP